MKDSKTSRKKSPSRIKTMLLAGAMTAIGALYGGCVFDKSGLPYNNNQNNNNVVMLDGGTDAGDAGQNNNDAGLDATVDSGADAGDAGVLPDPTYECPSDCFVTQQVPVAASGNTLTLNEPLGDVKEIYSSFDATVLGTNSITTVQGTTSINNFLRFKWGASITGEIMPVYSKDDSDHVGDFLRAEDGMPLFRTELEFPSGLKSSVSTANTLDNLVGKEIRILGERFAITQGYIDAQNRLNIEAVGNYTSVTMPENDQFSFTCGSTNYTIDTSLVDLNNEVQLTFNNGTVNETTQQLSVGQNEILQDGSSVVVTDITPYNDGKMVTLHFGDRFLHISDATLGEYDGDVEINNEPIEDSEVNIVWHENNNVVSIDNIIFTTTTDGVLGEIPHVASGDTLSSHLDEPEGMISDKWDIAYGGLTQPASENISFQASGTDELRMSFHNTQGIEYSNIRLAFVDGTGLFYGDDANNLVFQQPTVTGTGDSHTIGPGDYFIVSKDGDTPTGVTRVLRYESYSSSNNTLTFTDVGSGSTSTASISPVPGCPTYVSGSLAAGGYNFGFRVCYNSLGAALHIDLDGQNGVGGKAFIVTENGAIMDLGYQTDNPARQPVAGNTIDMYLMTDASKTVDSAQPESVLMQVTGNTSTSEIDINVPNQPSAGIAMYTDPFDNEERGMSTYGVLVTKDLSQFCKMDVDYPESQRLPSAYLLFDTECNE